MAAAMLPSQFADLEPYAEEWCLETQDERYAKRYSVPLPELQKFYDTVLARLDAGLEYIDQFQVDDLPDDVVNLMRLMYSMLAIAPSVECWHQGPIPDTGASMLTCVTEPVP